MIKMFVMASSLFFILSLDLVEAFDDFPIPLMQAVSEWS